MEYMEQLGRELESKVADLQKLLLEMATNTNGISNATNYGFLANELDVWLERVQAIEGVKSDE